MAKISFCGLTDEEQVIEEPLCGFTVFSAPYDVTSSYIKGACRGAEAIINASTYLELYDEELDVEPAKFGIETKEPLNLKNLSPEEMVAAVEEASAKIVKTGTIPVMLGGDHSVTTGLFRALKEKYNDLSVLHFDAHADMRDSYEGSRYSHACTGKRMADECKVAQVGIRSLSLEEAKFLKTADNVKTYWAKDIKGSLPNNSKNIYGDIDSFLTDNVFITIDLDVFDPSVMPATGTPEPGGLTWYDVLNTIREVAKDKNIVGFDVVELCPIDGMVAPDFMAAKLVYKTMGYIGVSKK